MKALAEDPSVFEYDNIYDDLQEKKKKSDPRLQKKDTRVCQQPSIVCSYSNYGSCVLKFPLNFVSLNISTS